GGASSIHTNALDEALALPTTEAATLALRTQQILAHESGLTSHVDPLAGSWFLERLTQDLVDEARVDIEAIDRLGGMVAAIERGVPQRWITDSAHAAQVALEQGAMEIVGVNVHRDEEPLTIDTLAIDEDQAARHIEAVARRRAGRDQARVQSELMRLAEAARGPDNLMPVLIDCARAGVTIGEMCGALREVWGEYVEPVSI